MAVLSIFFYIILLLEAYLGWRYVQYPVSAFWGVLICAFATKFSIEWSSYESSFAFRYGQDPNDEPPQIQRASFKSVYAMSLINGNINDQTQPKNQQILRRLVTYLVLVLCLVATFMASYGMLVFNRYILLENLLDAQDQRYFQRPTRQR